MYIAPTTIRRATLARKHAWHRLCGRRTAGVGRGVVYEARHLAQQQISLAAVPVRAEAFADRNIQLCAVISVLLVSYLVCCWAFLPLYLTSDRGFSPDVTKWLMATLGISAGIGSFAVAALSDRIGRKPAIVGFSFLGVILPLGAMYFTGSPWLLALMFFFGWALNGVFPLFMATIPSESVDPRLTASLTGIVMGIGEVLGGVLSPSIAGALSDSHGRSAVMWLMLGLTIAAGIVGMGLRETAPRVLSRRSIGTRLSPAM